MKLGPIPENLLERLALTAGLVPTPTVEVFLGILLIRAIMVGTRLGVFEALARGPAPAAAVAARCGTHPGATEKLLHALVGAGYLRLGPDGYAPTRAARRWLTRGAGTGAVDAVLFGFLVWELMEGCEEFVRTGRTMAALERMSRDDWGTFQRGMRSLSDPMAREVALRTPVPRGARDLLDVAGSHGFFSVALCRRHPALSAVVLELPQAIEHAAPILAVEGMGERVRHVAGDALRDELGAERYDVALVANVLHCYDEPTCRGLIDRVGRALRPNGVLVVLESTLSRTTGRRSTGQAAALSDLYLALVGESGSGAWSFEAVAAWQRAAGLAPRRPLRLFTAPTGGLQIARKPG